MCPYFCARKCFVDVLRISGHSSIPRARRSLRFYEFITLQPFFRIRSYLLPLSASRHALLSWLHLLFFSKHFSLIHFLSAQPHSKYSFFRIIQYIIIRMPSYFTFRLVLRCFEHIKHLTHSYTIHHNHTYTFKITRRERERESEPMTMKTKSEKERPAHDFDFDIIFPPQ